MAIKMPQKNYYTFPELMKRWNCEADDLFQLIFEEQLIPSYFFNMALAMECAWKPTLDGLGVTFEMVSDESKLCHGFYYLIDPLRRTVLDLEFTKFSRDRLDTAILGQHFLFLEVSTINFQELLQNGVFMFSEVAMYEENAKVHEKALLDDKPLTTTERNTLLKLVIGMAVKGYSYDPRIAKSTAPKEIAADLDALGIPITDDTVRKYLKAGVDTVLPKNWHQL